MKNFSHKINNYYQIIIILTIVILTINCNINNCDFVLVGIMKSISLWKTSITQWTNICQATNAEYYKVIWGKSSGHRLGRQMDFNITEYKKFINMVSDFTLQLENLSSNFGIVSKKNIYSYSYYSTPFSNYLPS